MGDGEVGEWQRFLRLFPLGNTQGSGLSRQLLYPGWLSGHHRDQASHLTLGQVVRGHLETNTHGDMWRLTLEGSLSLNVTPRE